MTTEDDFHRALDANPDDWQTRLVFADWLQERDDPRAEGYRALGILQLRPRWFTNAPAQWYCTERIDPWPAEDRGDLVDMASATCSLPSDWFDLCDGGLGNVNDKHGIYLWHYETKTVAEDAAVLAFAKLPAERRAELLATQPQWAA